MLTVNKLIPGARGLAPVLLKRAAQVELDWDVRQKSRFDAIDSQGRTLGVFLPRGTVVRGGDCLVAEDGSLIRVLAAPQSVLVVRHCAEHGSAFDLARAAYHLGNRHVALDLRPDRLQLESDHVLADMLRSMHLIVSEEQQPFEPEAGAYAASGHAHGQGKGHDHPHDAARETAHAAAHDAAHATATADPAEAAAPGRKPISIPIRAAAAPAPTAPHVHGPGCGHDHGHDHDHGHSH